MELSSIYNKAPVGIAALDRQLRFVRVNERLAAMNGRSVSEHIGPRVAEVIPDLASQADRCCKARGSRLITRSRCLRASSSAR